MTELCTGYYSPKQLFMRIRALIMLAVAGLVFISFISGSTEPDMGLKIGDRAPKIVASLPDGTSFDSDSLKGKMVLVDFWASYDAPSRIDNHRKTMLLERFANSEFLNSEGFVIVSISLDRFKTPFYKTIERDNLFDFYHICDFEGRESKLARKFEISNQMTNFLIDGDGRIVETSNDLDRIESTLHRMESVDRTRFAAYRR
ncbi:peroxiredoxin [Natronoflexus pectinivorans]|uniref:Peroxiredoxin n=2 Tax=Natronoflexus pectinivorans TaxID=682526 RepID=A0A4R2GMD8_9BACT|nr:peroxiredoxin [Natronoflexus pectinivorans]